MNPTLACILRVISHTLTISVLGVVLYGVFVISILLLALILRL